jgi:hypothetical protein
MKKAKKNGNLVRCPREPKNRYYREVCEEIFRKGGIRTWCKTCEIFEDEKKSVNKN